MGVRGLAGMNGARGEVRVSSLDIVISFKFSSK